MKYPKIKVEFNEKNIFDVILYDKWSEYSQIHLYTMLKIEYNKHLVGQAFNKETENNANIIAQELIKKMVDMGELYYNHIWNKWSFDVYCSEGM